MTEWQDCASLLHHPGYITRGNAYRIYSITHVCGLERHLDVASDHRATHLHRSARLYVVYLSLSVNRADDSRPDGLVQAICRQDAQIRCDPNIRDQDCFCHWSICLLGHPPTVQLRADRCRLVGIDHSYRCWAYGHSGVSSSLTHV